MSSIGVSRADLGGVCDWDRTAYLSSLGRPGGDLLFHVLRRSTIGAEGFHGRVRDGIGCWAPRHDHQVIEAKFGIFECDGELLVSSFDLRVLARS